jgi:zinc-finger binding domain of transposase IS66
MPKQFLPLIPSICLAHPRNGGAERQLPVLERADAYDRRGDERVADVVPAQYRVIVTHRPKFACRVCEKMVLENEHGLPAGARRGWPILGCATVTYGMEL